MRLRLLIPTLLATTIVGTGPTMAGDHCSCLSITSSGYCTKYSSCEPLPMFAPTPPLKPSTSLKDCPRRQALICDSGTCTVVCDPPKKKS